MAEPVIGKVEYAPDYEASPATVPFVLRLRHCPTCDSDDPKMVRVQGQSKMPDGRLRIGGFYTVVMASIYCSDPWHEVDRG